MSELEPPDLSPLIEAESRHEACLKALEHNRAEIDRMTAELSDISDKIDIIHGQVAATGGSFPKELASLRKKTRELKELRTELLELEPKLRQRVDAAKRIILGVERKVQACVNRYWGAYRRDLIDRLRTTAGPLLAELKAIYGPFSWQDSLWRDLTNGWAIPESTNSAPRRVKSRKVSTAERAEFEEQDRIARERRAEEQRSDEERITRERREATDAANWEKEKADRQKRIDDQKGNPGKAVVKHYSSVVQ